MNIRFATNEDNPQIIKYCSEHDMQQPKGQTVLLAERDSVIVGLLGIDITVLFEPWIADDSSTARDLYNCAIGTVLGKTKVVEALIEKDDVALNNIANKLEFKKYPISVNRYTKIL